MKKYRRQPVSFLLAAWLLFLAGLSGCTVATASPTPLPPAPEPAEAVSPHAQIQFTANTPDVEFDPAAETILYLEILNDPAGAGAQSERHAMEKLDGGDWQLNLTFPPGSLIRYRYVLETGADTRQEHTLTGQPAAERVYYAYQPGEVMDIVSAWDANGSDQPAGQLIGTVTDELDKPLPDMQVTAGGFSTITGADGSFQILGLPVGLHNLVVTSIHGATLPFQQGAVIEAEAITPAPVVMQKARFVNITFLLEQTGDPPQDAQIRLIGNLYENGNNFSYPYGINYIDIYRAPIFTRLEDGRYVLTLSLPVGHDFHYQYSLGDAYWNTELETDGQPKIRRLIIPNEDTIVPENIITWRTGETPPVIFELTVPPETPVTDIVTIQFMADRWRDPLPMRRAGDHRWVFTLYPPSDLGNELTYRYCRNTDCIAAPAAAVNQGPAELTLLVDTHTGTDTDGITRRDDVDVWAWLPAAEEQITIIGAPVQPRDAGFMAGIELQTLRQGGLDTAYEAAFSNIESLGANWAFLTPSWHLTCVNPPRLAFAPGQDLYAAELNQIIQQAQAHALKIALYPGVLPDGDPAAWWADAARDGEWWQNWFDQLQAFYIHFAWLAQQNGLPALIVGGPDVSPAYPHGILPNGKPSGVLADAEQRWSGLVQEIRAVYQGEVMFAVENPADMSFSDEFLQQFDGLYILADIRLTPEAENEPDYSSMVDAYLMEQVLPLSETVQRKIILAIGYPSHPDAALGCVQAAGGCQGFDVLNAPGSEAAAQHSLETTDLSGEPDFDIQYKIYESFLNAVNQNEWVMGLVSRGYYAPVERRDFSSSVRGKPASALLWYWLPRFVSSEPL